MTQNKPSTDVQEDHPHEECGVIGICAPSRQAAAMVFVGLSALQHRGQESSGMVVANGESMSVCKGEGLVSQVFAPDAVAKLKGHYAIGHNRYSTTGSASLRNVQPFMAETTQGSFAMAHNGNLANAAELRSELIQQGVCFSSSSDTEVMMMMIACNHGITWEERIRIAMQKWIGAYCIVVLTHNGIYAARDPWGFRPLCTGLLPENGYVVASETGALRSLDCERIRDVSPGEIISFSNDAIKVTEAIPASANTAMCIFEYIYFARPDHTWSGMNVHQVRERFGEELARELITKFDYRNGQRSLLGDVVIPVPASSIPAAMGFSRVSGIPYDTGFVRNDTVGRTFIEPTDSCRQHGITRKFSVISQAVKDKRVVVIDDSLVRGHTIKHLIALLRGAGAKYLRIAIASPPIRYPCFMGVDFGQSKDLIAHKRTVHDICECIGADNLHYLSVQGMARAIQQANRICKGCFTGRYPIPVDLLNIKTIFE